MIILNKEVVKISNNQPLFNNQEEVNVYFFNISKDLLLLQAFNNIIRVIISNSNNSNINKVTNMVNSSNSNSMDKDKHMGNNNLCNRDLIILYNKIKI